MISQDRKRIRIRGEWADIEAETENFMVINILGHRMHQLRINSSEEICLCLESLRACGLRLIEAKDPILMCEKI